MCCGSLHQQFRDLHRVEGGALADLVAAGEEVQPDALGLGEVAADAADVDVVLVGGVERRGEAVVGAVVEQRHAGGLLHPGLVPVRFAGFPICC